MALKLQNWMTRRKPQWVATGVYRLALPLVNVYFLGKPGAPWVLIDTGISGSAEAICQAAEYIYGEDTVPEAIILTHGHFDHAGSLTALLKHWPVPVYAHEKEIPFLVGQSDYPPADPTVGGWGGQLSRFYTNKSIGLITHPKVLPADNSVPHLPGWRWIHTPGHTPGHISLFRDQDRVLLAGDAITTLNQHDLGDFLSGEGGVQGPPAYFTPDWVPALRSIDRLAALQPSLLASGHGKPLKHPALRLDLLEFADRYYPPQHGRYALQPPHYDESGVTTLPPPVSDPLPGILAGAGVGLLAGLFVALLRPGKKPHTGVGKELRHPSRRDRPTLRMKETRRTPGKGKRVW